MMRKMRYDIKKNITSVSSYDRELNCRFMNIYM